MLVERTVREHETEEAAPLDLDRALWSEVVEILVVASAVARRVGTDAASVPCRVLEWTATRLRAAVEGHPEPALGWRRGGKKPSPEQALGQEFAVEYVRLAAEGFLEDPHPVKTVRRIFERGGPGGLLAEKTWRRWKDLHEPHGRLRRQILDKEGKGARDSAGRADRGALGRAILERWAVKGRVGH